MKFSNALFFLHFAAQASPTPTDPYAQLAPFLVYDALIAGRTYKTEQLPPLSTRPGVTRVRMWHGPVRAVPEKQPREGVPEPDYPYYWLKLQSDFPRDITLLRANTKLVFADGTPATLDNGVRTRRLVLINSNPAQATIEAPAFSCDGEPVYNKLPFIIDGSRKGETYYSSVDGKFNSGFWVTKWAELQLGIEATSLTADTKTLYSVTEMEFIKGDAPGFLQSKAETLNVTQCDSPFQASAMIPEGRKKYSVKSVKPVIAVRDGIIVAAQGTMQTGGVNILINLNGKQVCDTRAVYAPSLAGRSTIYRMTPCQDPIKVAKGDNLTFEAFYNEEIYPQDVKRDSKRMEGLAQVEFSYAEKKR